MDIFHERFHPLLFPTVSVPTPHLYRHPFITLSETAARQKYFDLSAELIEKHAGSACAFIVEPVVQGAAGMIVHPRGYLHHLRQLTRRHNMLLIADEVAVGFGRTGKMFACEWENVSPDLMCLGKGITGGYLPLAATLTSEEIFSAFLGESVELKTFFHGHTYTGNPLACAAALASLQVFEDEKTLAPEVFGPKTARYAAGMTDLAKLPQVGSVRFVGLMGGVELVADRQTKRPFPFEERMGHRVCMACREHGVILRPLGDVVVLMPPLAVSIEELDLLFEVTATAIQECIL
jgi:adenosylmethionine-8-amino-7-oxononanoate aminotransferase